MTETTRAWREAGRRAFAAGWPAEAYPRAIAKDNVEAFRQGWREAEQEASIVADAPCDVEI